MPDVVLNVTLTRARTSLVQVTWWKIPAGRTYCWVVAYMDESVDFDVHAESGLRQKWHSDHLLT